MGISVLLTEVSYNVSMSRAEFHFISCEGRVLDRGKPYDDAYVTIHFSEYEPSSLSEKPPERAFAGEFEYRSKLSEKDSSPYFWLFLRYVPEDAGDLLIPLLNHEAGTEVILSCTLIVENLNWF